MGKAKTPKFELISKTELPLESIFAVWAQSRPTQYPELFKWAKEEMNSDVITADVVRLNEVLSEKEFFDTIKMITTMDLPITESIHFTWGFTGLPIEWREQAVRKRQWGFWLTSMREFTM